MTIVAIIFVISILACVAFMLAGCYFAQDKPAHVIVLGLMGLLLLSLEFIIVAYQQSLITPVSP